MHRSAGSLVTTAHDLGADGVGRRDYEAELHAGRRRRAGHAIVQHNGPLSLAQRRQVALVHAGPEAMLTAFTAAEVIGLKGWESPEIHVVAGPGTRLRTGRGDAGSPVPIRLHLTGTRPRHEPGFRIEARADALVRAAGTFDSPRPACGLLAAAVQQRVTDTDALTETLGRFVRVRHRAALVLAVADIAGGSPALSEIDFVRLCRRAGLPQPQQQGVRVERSGRRRYLDASWRRADGRTVVVEVDGALHLSPRRWWDDQLRQNELVLTNAIVLRFPTVIVRTDPSRVVDQLRRALYPSS